MSSSKLRQLRRISLSDVTDTTAPEPKIRYDEDVNYWKNTTGYSDYQLFLRRLNESVVGYSVPQQFGDCSQAITNLLSLLDTLDTWIDESPPQNPEAASPRFGNPTFRDYWGDRLRKESQHLLNKLLGPELSSAIRFVKPYLMESFGSFQRLDYGTGHETSFALFLCCLTLIRFLDPSPEEERAIVFRVFVRYLRLCWKLQDAYKLEPAGSHGVWGLDDYSFLPYIFGSGQLRDQTAIPVSAVLDVKLAKDEHPMDRFDNLYFMSIARIHQVKYGPFFEHSSQLYTIATQVQNWGKVNKGLFEMYQVEVLGRRVVVQHLSLGGLVQWDR
ncbi:Phosphotyrosyl phosphatase activator [Gyrodon lividus]|nr:Phosphotyrosyl phosphatase activator [Gyrodon lividus]